MELTDAFWKEYELDLQEIKIAYLSWAITHAKEPDPRFRHLFLWDHQEDFCIINSRFGSSFAMSPFGFGVRAYRNLKNGSSLRLRAPIKTGKR